MIEIINKIVSKIVERIQMSFVCFYVYIYLYIDENILFEKLRKINNSHLIHSRNVICINWKIGV